MRPACLLFSLLISFGCGDDDTSPADGGGLDAAAIDAGPPDAGPTFERIPESEALAGREGCAFERGAMPWETVGEEFPIGWDLPFDQIVMVMQENRSFDHYFGAMPGVDGIPMGASNPDAMGTPVMPFHTDDYCIRDVAHSWNASHRQYNDGANDGFVTTNDPNGARALGYLTDADIPYYWDLYSTFAMSDEHFCSVLTGTWTNRFYYQSGTSFGRVSNREIPPDRIPPDDEHHVVFQQLDAAGIDWRVYNSDIPTIFGLYPHYAGRNIGRIQPLDSFFAAAAAGALAPVTYIDPSFTLGVEQSDEHPPANPQFGQAFIKSIVDALFASPQWSSTVLVITYDEHGGFYDHVPPPEACHPGDYDPILEGRDPGNYDRLGFRVPLAVVSPFSRAGYVSDRVTDLTSVLRLVQTRFLLPALTGRDANAWPMLDMFDFDAPPFMTPPTLVDAPIDEAQRMACIAEFGSGGRF